MQVLLNEVADQPLSSILTGDSDQLQSFHAVVTRSDDPSFDDDLTVVVSQNLRTVTMSKAATAVTVSPRQKDNVDVQSGMPQPDCGEATGQKSLGHVLDTAALAAALPSASSTAPGSAFAAYNFSTTFTKSETGWMQLIDL